MLLHMATCSALPSHFPTLPTSRPLPPYPSSHDIHPPFQICPPQVLLRHFTDLQNADDRLDKATFFKYLNQGGWGWVGVSSVRVLGGGGVNTVVCWPQHRQGGR